MILIRADVIAFVADGIATGSTVYCILKGTGPSKTSWWQPKSKTIQLKRVASYTDTDVTGWNAMKST